MNSRAGIIPIKGVQYSPEAGEIIIKMDPLPPDSLLADPNLCNMTIQVIDLSKHYNNVRAFKRRVAKFKPTVIILGKVDTHSEKHAIAIA